MNKSLIEKRFSKNLSTYNKNAIIQKKMAEHLIGMLKRSEFDNILEIGCGTGFLTKLLLKNFKFKKYDAVDIVKNCEKYIKEISSDINFVQCDMEEYIDNTDKKYDLIISNASLQWIENIEEFVKKIYEKLNNNGILLFSIFGKENFREINLAMNKTLKYYTVGELNNLFSAFQTTIEEEIHIMAFKTPKEVLKHISMTGVNAIEQTFWTKSDLRNFENMYNNICSNTPTITYNPIYIKIG